VDTDLFPGIRCSVVYYSMFWAVFASGNRTALILLHPLSPVTTNEILILVDLVIFIRDHTVFS
jgi:hypothetical protein